MKSFAIFFVVSLISLASSYPTHNGMVYYQMPYYNPYQQAMLVHYSQQPGRSASATSAFASGDAIAAGTYLRENRVPGEYPNAAGQQGVNSDEGGVEAIAEAYPEDAPVQETVLFDQQNEQNVNEVIPLAAAPEQNDDKAVVIQEEPAIPTTIAPKKKVHIALDIPDASTSNDHDHDDENDEDEFNPVAPQKPNRNRGGSPTYTFFPVTFGRTAGGTVAIANAYSTGKGAVRSHAIAYGTSSGASRQQAARRHISDAQKQQA